MKKSKIIIISSVALLFIAAIIVLFAFFKTETGIYVKSPAGGSLFISENDGVPYETIGNFKTIGNPETGDRVLTVHKKTALESYPVQVETVFTIKIKKDYRTVDATTFPELAELGWIENESILKFSGEAVFKSSKIKIPDSWKAEDSVLTGSYYCDKNIKVISLKDSSDSGYMSLLYYPQNNFISDRRIEKEITLNNGMIAKVIYDNEEGNWLYVEIPDSNGYVFQNNSLNSDDSLTALEIIKTINF